MNKAVFCFFQLLILISGSFYGNLHAETFHSILIGDTDDPELKKVIRKDLIHIGDHIEDVFQALDTPKHFNQNVYMGKRVNVDILDELKGLNVETDDIIFLYFSGHGFNTKKTGKDKWPYLYFTNGDIGINSYDVVSLLMEHHQPRLIICFVDCCNNILKPREIPFLVNMQVGDTNLPRVKPSNIRKLFQETRGIIIISSASPGYYSEGTDKKGSCYTNSYIKIFNELMALDESSTWDDLLSKTQDKLWKRQQPFYELILH